MKEKICLFLKVFCMTTLFVVSVSCGLFTKNAFADDKFITGGPGTCTVDVLGVSDDSAFVKVIAVYLPQQYKCDPGTYLHVTETEAFCDDCPLNSYCPGGTFSVEDTYLGQNLCPDNYITVSTNSTSPSDCLPDSYCEWECTTPDCTPCGPSDIDGFIAVTPLMEAGDTFKFDLTAGGEFIIDWGDGTVENVEKRTGNISLQHTYQKSDQYRIKISGNASGYAANMPAISFQCKDDTGEYIVEHPLAGIEGSLGRVFPTINGVQPLFTKTFYGCDKVQNQTLPEYLFAGIKGKPAAHMFDSTFAGMTSLTEIPEKFTFGVSGAPADYVFANTFKETNISSIPEDLFLRIFGAPADGMFRGTFAGTQIESIPAEIFKGISGSKNTPIGEYAFANTFENTPITEIPEGLFKNVIGAPSKGVFYATFKNTYITKLPETGMFPKIEGAPAESMFDYTFANTPISNIPESLFSGIEGSPAPRMFASTFEGCNKIEQSIPGALFGGLEGGPASGMFNRTFFNASKLQSWIPTNLFEKLHPFTDTGVLSDEIAPMGDIFLGSGIVEKCPDDMVQYLTGFEQYFDNKVSCTFCPANSVIENGQCICNAGYWVFDGTEILENTFIIEEMGAGKKCVSIPEYTITYECGDGTVIEGSVTSANVTHGSEYTVSGAMCDKINEIQTGWKLKDTNSTYDFSHVINNVTSDFVFTAVYGPKTYTITYECGDGGYSKLPAEEMSQTVEANGLFETLNEYACTKPGYEFVYWESSIDEEHYDPSSRTTYKYSKDLTLTAQYEEKDISEYSFWFKVVPVEDVTNEVDIEISAKGTFKINWGDGSVVEEIVNENAKAKQITHKYSFDKNDPDKTYTVSVGGWATGYAYNSNDTQEESVIKIACDEESAKVTAAGGDIMDVFPTINGVQPSFKNMFFECTYLEDINEQDRELKFNIVGKPRAYMFENTFKNTGLTSIPEYLFTHDDYNTDSTAPGLFAGTFANTMITEIPYNLFDEIEGAPAKNMFMETFANTKIEEIPYDLFYSIEGAPAEGMFQSTFYNTRIKSIPPELFGSSWGAGINGAPAKNMFMETFARTDIEEIPVTLFSGIYGAPAEGMFQSTFSDTPITSIPESLFDEIEGVPAKNMFMGTFARTDIEEILPDLFSGIEGAPAEGMFQSTFSDTPITSIPESLFSGIYDAPAKNMFMETFARTDIEAIPEYLFYRIEGAPAEGMFQSTFSNTPIKLIPKDLFYKIEGVPAKNMFKQTFMNCKNIVSQIPANLFKGINGNLAEGSFYQTFAGIVPSIYYTDEISQYEYDGTYNFIPKGLFDDDALKGATDENNAMTNVFGSAYDNNGNLEFSGLLTRCPVEFKRVETSFDKYFKHANDTSSKVVCAECPKYSTQGENDTVCACIDGYVPYRLTTSGGVYCDAEDLLDKTLTEGDFCTPLLRKIEYDCKEVSPFYSYEDDDINFESYHEECDIESEHIQHSGWVDEYGNVHNFDEEIDWESFPEHKCVYKVEPTYKLIPEFLIHTKNGTSGPVDITIRANGTFYIDWGDGSPIETVSGGLWDNRYLHVYSTQGQYTIGISGDATGYPTPTLPSIAFNQSLINAIESVDGSLGDIFPTIGDKQPNFQAVFKDAKNMKTVLSDNLFIGTKKKDDSNYPVHGNTIAGMFKDTFSGCENLELSGDGDNFISFEGITGLAESVFEGTFRNCKKLKLAYNPFPNIQGGADYAFKETFMGCTNLAFGYPDLDFETCFDCALPKGMFAGISLPAKGMFQDTFKDCWYLSGRLPDDLFGGVGDSPKLELAQDMFNGTFAFCENLSGQIPKTLFSRFEGNLVEGVFARTFQNAGFDLWVPKELFINFNNDQTHLDTVPTAMVDIFVDSNVATDCEPYGLTQYITGFERYWSERVSCQSPLLRLDYNCNGGDMAYTDSHDYRLHYTQNVKYGEQYTVRPGDLCTKDGYTFQGWYYDDNPDEVLAPGTFQEYNYKTNNTLYAKWERDSYFTISLVSHLYIQQQNGYSSRGPDVFAKPSTLYTDVDFPDWYTDKNLTDVFSKLTQIPKINKYMFRGFTTNQFATDADPLVIDKYGSIIPDSITINSDTTLYASYTKCVCGTDGSGVESCAVKSTTDDNKCEFGFACKTGFYSNDRTYVSESPYFVPTCRPIPKITVNLDSNYYATADATTGDSAETVSRPTTLYLDPGKTWYHSIKSPDRTIEYEEIIQLQTLPSYHTQTTNYAFRGFYTGKAGTGTQIIDSSGNIITTSDALNAFGSDTSIPAQTIYAYYVPIYNITYSCGLQNGTPPPEQSVVFNTEFTVQQNGTCTMPNNYFVKWKVEETDEILQPGDKVMYTYNSDITLVAQYENNKYFIVYDSNKGEGVIEDAVYECVAGTPCIVPENTYTRDEYYSIGWTCEGNEKCETGIILKKGDDLDSILITGKNGEIITLIAQWRKIGQFEINYNSAGGRGEDPSLVFCDGANDLTPENPYTNCLTPENPYTKDGYVFSRWEYTTNTGKSAYIYPGDDLSGLIEEDLRSITLTAVWDGIKIYYNYYDSGNILENMKPKYCISGSACPAPNIPYEKEGYIFEGWKCSSDECDKEALILPNNTNLTKIIDLSKVSDGDVIDLHAVWKPITFFINYDGNGNTGGTAPTEPVSCDYDEECNAPSNTYEKAGYKFVGWLCSGDEAECAGEIINANDSLKNASLVDAGNIYLTAQWAPAEFTVVYDVAGGTPEIATQNCIYGQDCLVSDIKPEKSGYTFNNWTCSDDLNGVVCNGATILPSDNISTVGIIDGVVITLTATYTPITYTITYNANGGDGKMESSVFTYGVAGTLSPNTFTRTNYNFVGWAKTSDATVPEYADQAEVIDWSNVNGDIITLYAVWQEIPAIYTITYHANGGTGEMAQSTFNMDVEYSLPLNEFTRTGYTFKHWATNSDGSGNTYTDGQNVINLTTTRGANVDLYAVWKVAVCTDYNGSVLKRCDDPIMSSQEMIESGILESKSESEYKITNFDKYMRNQKWAVNFPTYGEGTGTISGSAFCGPVDKAEYGTVVKSIEDTPVADAILKQAHAGCWCQVGPTDTTKFWVAAGVYDEGNTWAEKTDACRANCPDFCAQLVATDSKFRTKLYGGEDACPIGTDYKKACCDGEYETEDGTYELCPDGTWCMNCQMNKCDAEAMYTATNGATSPNACGTYLHVGLYDDDGKDHKIFMRPNAKMTPLALHVNKRGTVFHANMSTEKPNDGKKKHLKTMINGIIYYIYDNFLI